MEADCTFILSSTQSFADVLLNKFLVLLLVQHDPVLASHTRCKLGRADVSHVAWCPLSALESQIYLKIGLNFLQDSYTALHNNYAVSGHFSSAVSGSASFYCKISESACHYLCSFAAWLGFASFDPTTTSTVFNTSDLTNFCCSFGILAFGQSLSCFSRQLLGLLRLQLKSLLLLAPSFILLPLLIHLC